MEFLPQSNKVCEGDTVADQILATGKRVVIIGGGDTGADCLGTSHRQHAQPRHAVRTAAEAPRTRAPHTPWPLWPMQLRMESSHEEGGLRDWSVSTVRFSGDEHGNVKKLHGVRVGPPPKFEAMPGSEFELDVDLVLLAMGFTGPVRGGMIEDLGVALDNRGNVATDANYVVGSRSLRGGRYAARAVVGGMGDHRRASGGAWGRRISYGRFPLAGAIRAAQAGDIAPVRVCFSMPGGSGTISVSLPSNVRRRSCLAFMRHRMDGC